VSDLSDAREILRQFLETEMLLGGRDIPWPVPAGGNRAPEAVVGAAASLPRDPSAGSSNGPSGARASTPPQRAGLSPEEVGQRVAALERIAAEVAACTKCGLHRTRTKTVPGQGPPTPRLVFVGEAPGYDEDRQGLAFVGRAGQLLTQMVAAMGLRREDVFICNVLKCRPPDNRTPAADEIAACSPYLFEQLRVLGPEVIVALGAPAAQTLLGTHESIGRLRGRFHDFYPSGTPMIGPPVPLMPTYHPAYLLRNPGEKGKAWEDLKKVMQRLGLPIPARYR